jgi:hypothetical protein
LHVIRHTGQLRGVEDKMGQKVSHFEKPIPQLRHALPANNVTALANNVTALAFDQNENWERIAMKIIDEGYFGSADEFVRFVDACLRYISSEQVASPCANAIGARKLAESIACRCASEDSSSNLPTTDEIAGLLESEWMTSGHFRSLRREINHSGTEIPAH